MEALLQWLDAAALVIGDARLTWAEVLGAVSGLVCVALVARQHVWNWPIGLANNVFWALLFWRVGLYADSTLQGVFFVLGCYGWWRWVRGVEGAPLVVRRTGRREWVALAGLVTVATVGLAAWLAYRTRSPAPVADASVLTLSLAATWGQAEKRLESWWIWITVDVISVPLYVSRGLHLTAAVYVVFGALCVVGLRRWARALDDGRAVP